MTDRVSRRPGVDDCGAEGEVPAAGGGTSPAAADDARRGPDGGDRGALPGGPGHDGPDGGPGVAERARDRRPVTHGVPDDTAVDDAAWPAGAAAVAHARAARSEPQTAGRMPVLARLGASVAGLRRRHAWVDHLVRAAIRFDEVDSTRFAAAITYYAFLAVFPLLLLAFSVLGYVVADDTRLIDQLKLFLSENLPNLPVDTVIDARNKAGIIGFVVLFYAGVSWVDVVRSSIRAVWGRDEWPGNYLVRKVVDAGALIGLGLVLLTSAALTVLVSAGAHRLLDLLGLERNQIGEDALTGLAFVAGLAVDVVAFVAFLVLLPRLRMPFRRVIGPALIGAVGLELLKTLGRFYFERTATNPAYAAVGGTIGLLVFLYLFNQLLLFCAALTATARQGRVTERPTWDQRRAALSAGEH